MLLILELTLSIYEIKFYAKKRSILDVTDRVISYLVRHHFFHFYINLEIIF
jgi:hypothetical protein